MSSDIPITLPPEEIAAWPVPVIVRVAEKCEECGGCGWHVGVVPPRGRYSCGPCNGTGYADPYAVGDVLFHQEEWHLADFDCEDDGEVVSLQVQYFDGDTRWFSFDGEPPAFPPADAYPHTADTMPCWASRYRAAIEDVRLVRLQGPMNPVNEGWVEERDAWDRNNPDHPWSSNPTVRVVSLRPVEEK